MVTSSRRAHGESHGDFVGLRPPSPPPPALDGRESKYMMRYQEAIRGVEGSLLAKSYPGGLWFVGELDGDTFSPKVPRFRNST